MGYGRLDTQTKEYALVYAATVATAAAAAEAAELSSKVAADMYTKAFHDPMRWKHACMLVNIFQQLVGDVPYTQTPMLPKGSTSQA